MPIPPKRCVTRRQRRAMTTPASCIRIDLSAPFGHGTPMKTLYASFAAPLALVAMVTLDRGGAAVRHASAGRLHEGPVLGRDPVPAGCRPPDAARFDGEDDDGLCRLRPHQEGAAEAERHGHGAAGNVEEVAWPQAGSTMFLSPNEQVSVANLLYGIVTLSATTPASCWPSISRAPSRISLSG